MKMMKNEKKIEQIRKNETQGKALDASRIADRDTKQNFKSDMVETMVVTAFHRKRQKTQRDTPSKYSLGTVQDVPVHIYQDLRPRVKKEIKRCAELRPAGVRHACDSTRGDLNHDPSPSIAAGENIARMVLQHPEMQQHMLAIFARAGENSGREESRKHGPIRSGRDGERLNGLR